MSEELSVQERIRRRAQKLTKAVTPADGYYRWVVVGENVLPPKDDKPRTTVMKAAPLRDPTDVNSAMHEFTVEKWIPLEGLEGQRLTPDEAKESRFVLKALFPDRIDLFKKEGEKQWSFAGAPCNTKEEKAVANERQQEQLITLGYEIVEGTTSLKDLTFYALAKNGNNGRVFLNYISEEPNSKFEVTEPTEFTGGAD